MSAREKVDVLVVGSGPVGAAFARLVHERSPKTRILMVDSGPQLTERPGANVRNLVDPEARARAEALSQGPDTVAAVRTEMGERAAVQARPGTHLVRRPDPTGSEQKGMPAAAMSTNVGGMGAHWTCACPPPRGSERIAFLDAAQFDADLAVARRLLSVTTEGFPESAVGRTVRAALGRAFAGDLPSGRPVQRMPLACLPQADGPPAWAGADTVLGQLADRPQDRFELRPLTLCRRLEVDESRVSGAVLEQLPTGELSVVDAQVVVVAGDAFRTPQLLWASGLRPPALGRYLNDQPQVIAAAQVAADAGPARGLAESQPGPARDHLSGVSWVPFDDGVHPFHGQVMQIDASPIALGVEDENAGIVGLGWFCAKDVREEDRVEFSDAETDANGMPAMTIHYDLTHRDHENIRDAVDAQRRAAAELGGFAPRGEPKLLPAGSSLHYQGTVRMGEVDDGTSVCDRDSRVWGHTNLFVGGNGVIPTGTACNPTLTSVALAVRAARRIEQLIRDERIAHAH
jgi:hypothetical protein